MLKPLAYLSAAILFGIASAPGSGRSLQEAAPGPAPAQTPTPVKGPVALDATNPVTPTPASQAQAKVVYERDCAMCHGDNGNGKTDLATSMHLTMADWTQPKTLADKHDGELFDIIRVGEDKMPPEPVGRATDSEVWNMVIYIRKMANGQPAATDSTAP